MYTNIHESILKLGSFVMALLALSISAINGLHAQDGEQESKQNSNSSDAIEVQAGAHANIEYYIERDLNEESLLYNGLMAVRWLLWPNEFDSSWPLYAYSVEQIQQECEATEQGYKLYEHPLGKGVVATQVDDQSGRFEAHPLLAVNFSGNDSADEEQTDHITLGDVCRRAEREHGANVLFATQRPILDSDVTLRLSRDINADIR